VIDNFVVTEFRNYYKAMDLGSYKILDLQHRELAFLQFGEQTMIRHLSFDDETELKTFVVGKPPMHMYYSSAYYRHPQDTNMSKKSWLGADLVFDIDADHIKTDCKINHDKWMCLDCKTSGSGFPPEACTNCGNKRIETTTWVCDECLKVAKNEIFKLLEDYLVPDFGLALDEIEICFSGHRGYHLHILPDVFRQLTNDGRREIADYVRGIGLSQELQGFRVLRNNEPLIGPDIKDGGWRGRIARAIYAFIEQCSPERLGEAIGSPKAAKRICDNKQDILEKMSRTPSWWGALKPEGVQRFNKIASASLGDVVCHIDERVTIDTKRLMRYPNSLHGKSGLKAVRIGYGDLERFDPLKDAIAFKNGFIKVYVKDIPRIRIGENEIGPLGEGVEVEVPKALGIYLICRCAAEIRT
jgi:DNA primase small subunit